MTNPPVVAVPFVAKTMNPACPHCRILKTMLDETGTTEGTPQPRIYEQFMNVASQVLADLISRTEPAAIPQLAADMQNKLGRQLSFYMQHHHGSGIVLSEAPPHGVTETQTEVVALPPTEVATVDRPPPVVAVPSEPLDFPVYPLKFDRAKYH